MERLVTNSHLKVLCIFILFYSKHAVGQNLTSRLRFEIVGFGNVDFVYFSKNTQSTTSNELFKIHSALGKNYSATDTRGIGLGNNERTYNFEYGFLASYEINPKLDLRFGILSASAGTFGNPGVFAYTFGSGESSRVFKAVFAPSKNIWHHNKHRMGLTLSIGVSLDIVRNGNSNVFMANSILNNDTIRFIHTNSIKNNIGFSMLSSLQYYFILKNNNRVNFTLSHSLGFIPLVSSNYTYSINQNNYYTEIWNNGTFVRLGIGYEFQLFKKWFGYQKREKVNGTKKYIYK